MSARDFAAEVPHHKSSNGVTFWNLADVDQLVDLYAAHTRGEVKPYGVVDRRMTLDYRDLSCSGWAGGTPSDALRLARHGWPDGERQLVDAITKADALAVSGVGQLTNDSRADVLPDLVPSVSPSARWDLGDYMTGAPDLYREQVPPPARVLKLVFAGSVASRIDAPQITAAAGAMVSVVRQLQAQGVSVSIDVVYGGRGCNKQGTGVLFVVPLLREGFAMELDRLAYWLAHPTAFRRFAFGLYEMGAPFCGEGYGTVAARWAPAGAALREYVARDPSAVLLPALLDVIDGASGDLSAYARKVWSEAIQGGAA